MSTNEILIIASIFIAGFLFSNLKGYIIKRFFKQAYTQVVDENTKAELKKLYEKGVLTVKEYAKKLGVSVVSVTGKTEDQPEPFIWSKFKKIFSIASGGEWAKSIKEIIDIRKFIIYSVIISSIFAYGWYRGIQNTPVKVNIGYGQEAKIELTEGNYLHIDKDGTVRYRDKSGNIIKKISVKDIPGLRKKLAPIGLQFEPIVVVGAGMGADGASGEGGVGISWLRYWKWKVDSFLTNKGLYPLGTSYSITNNSGIGLGIGKGWKGDNRILIYYRLKF